MKTVLKLLASVGLLSMGMPTSYGLLLAGMNRGDWFLLGAGVWAVMVTLCCLAWVWAGKEEW